MGLLLGEGTEVVARFDFQSYTFVKNKHFVYEPMS